MSSFYHSLATTVLVQENYTPNIDTVAGFARESSRKRSTGSRPVRTRFDFTIPITEGFFFLAPESSGSDYTPIFLIHRGKGMTSLTASVPLNY